jgi:hypothetical protein
MVDTDRDRKGLDNIVEPMSVPAIARLISNRRVRETCSERARPSRIMVRAAAATVTSRQVSPRCLGAVADQRLLAAATVALHARVPLVPAFFQGPGQMQLGHLLHRPLIRVTFGSPIPTAELPIGKKTTIELTQRLQAAIGELRSVANSTFSAEGCLP